MTDELLENRIKNIDEVANENFLCCEGCLQKKRCSDEPGPLDFCRTIPEGRVTYEWKYV